MWNIFEGKKMRQNRGRTYGKGERVANRRRRIEARAANVTTKFDGGSGKTGWKSEACGAESDLLYLHLDDCTQDATTVGQGFKKERGER